MVPQFAFCPNFSGYHSIIDRSNNWNLRLLRMKEDARAAAEAIIAYHKVQGQSWTMRAKTAFKCGEGMGLLIIVVALTELFTNTLLLMFDFVSNRSLVYMGT